ncbi:MAG: sugar phosphate isomerase/epimerase [bacterium]|nr:sugar phosphate isomerase/epimerase [bacterium]
MSRRTLLQMAAGATVLGAMPRARSAEPAGCTFSFSTYGMKTRKVEDAIDVVAGIGYDGIEMTAHSDWDSAPANLAPERRARVRDLLDEKGLKLTSLMEHVYPAKDDTQHAKDLDRLRAVVELARDLSPDDPPLIQTVLGGGDWESNKERIRDRLVDWIHVCKDGGIVLAIKPHRGGVMSTPSEAVWVIKQLDDTPWLRMVYDYSHYAFRGMPVEDTVATALPYTAHIAVKDAVKEADDKIVFKLPGESGAFDYANLLRLFYQGGYRGDVCCEVSGMVWNQPGYDPATAAKTCYANLAPAFEKAGVVRGGG